MTKKLAPLAIGAALVAATFSGAASAQTAKASTPATTLSTGTSTDGWKVTRNYCQVSDDNGNFAILTRGKTLMRVFGMGMQIKGDRVSFTDKDLRKAMPFSKAESAPLVENVKQLRQACKKEGFKTGPFGLF